MKQRLIQVVGILFIGAALTGVVLGQTRNAAIANDARSEFFSEELLREVRLTRQALEQLKKQLIQLEALAIQIRLQQDAVAASEARIDSIRSEAHSADEPLTQLRDRVGKLESTGSSGDEDERQRNRAELQEAKKEIERQQQRLDLLRSQDVQLTAQLQLDRARLNDLLSRLEILSGGTGDTKSNVQTLPSGPTGSPIN